MDGVFLVKSVALSIFVVGVLGCGGGGAATTPTASSTPQKEAPSNLAQAASAPAATAAASSPAATPPPTATAPYLRLVWVDLAHNAASDSGPGTFATPYRTIGAALRDLRPGDDVVIAAGVYRESLAVKASATGGPGTRLRALNARTVTIKGSVEVAGWRASGPGLYALPWSGDEPQQVFRAGAALQQVGGTVFMGYPGLPGHELATAHASEGGIWPGRVASGITAAAGDAFHYDAVRRELVVKLAHALTTGEKLEVSVQRQVLQAEDATGLSIEGLDFAHANTSLTSRWGAVKVSGRGNRLHNLVVRDMDAACVQLSGSDSSLTDSTIERCGQLGISGSGQRMRVAGNRVTAANTRGFNTSWEAGGMKLIGSDGLHDSVIKDNVVAFNHGDGIWIDWLGSGNLIEGNTTAYNDGFGIQYEASRSGTIRGNRSYGNGYRGIYLLESADCAITANVVVGNRMEGIGVVDGLRSAQDARLRPVNNRITGNELAWNDFNRNWVQLVLPGPAYPNFSDQNSLRAETLAPRLSLGFVGPLNAAFVSLAAWTQAVNLDGSSQARLVPMPPGLRAALDARRLLTAEELASYLALSGTN